MKRIILFIALVFYSFISWSQNFNTEKLETQIKKGIEKAYSASVRCFGYDTVRKTQNSSQFSAVVVSADGYILTVSHAIQPNRTYKVRFPDGKEVMAVALGKVGLQEMQVRPDIGMMKIMDKGSWPYAEMGWSNSLKVNEACFSISYPETLNQLLPTVRFGRIANVLTQWGFVQSTCKMEPGDSGGPLFDYIGRVVAMHSRCELPEDENYEVPIDTYRKYWTALKEPIDYKALPTKEDEVKTDPFAQRIMITPQLENLNTAFSAAELKYKEATVTLSSELKGVKQGIRGTAFIANNKTLIVSKSSLIGEKPMLLIKGELMQLTVLGRNQSNDLVLLEAPLLLKGALPLSLLNDNPEVNVNSLGKFLLSPLFETQKISVLSGQFFSLPTKFSAGYFGAPANFRDGKIILNRIAQNSPASLAKLAQGDQLTGINKVSLKKAEDYGAEMIKYCPGDTITVQAIRAGESFEVTAILTQRPKGSHPADNFEGGKSIRLDGFEKVFSHDAAIKANECGGPVFDAKGNLYGINIARFSRTTTLALPNNIIKDFIEIIKRKQL